MASSIAPEVGAEILRAYNTETPRPSAASLASRHGLQPRAVQRYLKQYRETVEKVTQNGVKTELAVAAAAPTVIAEIKVLTRDLPITSLCKVMAEAEAQYNALKGSENTADRALAGGYLDQMRKCAVEMAKWLGIDKGIAGQEQDIVITVRHEPPPKEQR